MRAVIALAGLLMCAVLVNHAALPQTPVQAHASFHQEPTASAAIPAPQSLASTPDAPVPTPQALSTTSETLASTPPAVTPTPESLITSIDPPSLYVVLKQPAGFVLARAPEDTGRQAGEKLQVLATFDDAFGQDATDRIKSLQASPDGRFVAIDGLHNNIELLWIFDTRSHVLSRESVNASGTFLHWLPGSADLFLYRPEEPQGIAAPFLKVAWKPGLWVGDAATGDFLDIALPSGELIDAAAAPDDSEILFSTTRDQCPGSDIWTIGLDGLHLKHVLTLDDHADDVADMFAWSPDGKSIAYERWSDDLAPFLTGDVLLTDAFTSWRTPELWLMDDQGDNQRLLVRADIEPDWSISWSPDSTKIAYTVSVEPAASKAARPSRVQQSMVKVLDLASRRSWSIGDARLTGARLNTNPTWSLDGKHILFTSVEPSLSRRDSSVRSWSVQVAGRSSRPGGVQISPTIAHVVACQAAQMLSPHVKTFSHRPKALARWLASLG